MLFNMPLLRLQRSSNLYTLVGVAVGGVQAKQGTPLRQIPELWWASGPDMKPIGL